MLIVLLIIVILICFLLAGIFAVISFLSGRPHSHREVGGGYVPSTFQFPDTSNESSALEATSIHVPDIFNELRIRADLEVLANQPTLLAQYIAQAELRFTQARQMAVLQRWTEFYKVGKEVITARTDLVRAHHDFLHINREGQIKVKEKDVSLARLDAELEEVELRKAQARYARENLGREPPKPEPPLSREERRFLEKRRIEGELARIRADKVTAVEQAPTEDEKIRIANIYDHQINLLLEELTKYL